MVGDFMMRSRRTIRPVNLGTLFLLSALVGLCFSPHHLLDAAAPAFKTERVIGLSGAEVKAANSLPEQSPESALTLAGLTTRVMLRTRHLPLFLAVLSPERVDSLVSTLLLFSGALSPTAYSVLFISQPQGRAPPSIA
jgi:hypothetical protein